MNIPADKSPQQSVLAPDLEVSGNLITTGDLVIQSRILGNISAKGLFLHESASVSGDVEAKRLVVSGRVEGNVVASEIALTASGRVTGSLHYDKLTVEAGATIEGDLKRVFLPDEHR